MFYKSVFDKDAKKWVISCQAELKVSPFLIVCESEDESGFYISLLNSGKLFIPTLDGQQFTLLKDYGHLGIPVFTVNPIFKTVKRNIDGKIIETWTNLTWNEASNKAFEIGDPEENQYDTYTIET